MSEAFRRMAGGFRLDLYGLIVIVIGTAVGMAALILVIMSQAMNQPGAQPQPGQQLQGPALFIAAAIGAVGLLGNLIRLVGLTRLAAVPPEVPGAKGRISPAITLLATAMLLGLAMNVEQLVVKAVPPQFAQAIAMIPGLLVIVSSLLVLRYTAAVAEFIGKPDLAKLAGTVFVLYLVMAVLLVLFAGVSVVAAVFAPQPQGGPPVNPGGPPPMPPPALVLAGLGILGVGCLMAVIGIVGLVMAIMLLVRMAAACDEYADDPAGRPADDRDYDDRDRWDDDRDRWDDDRRGR
ncbi:MAG: hypothetical protein U0871_01585 [Gemmataceae bacterium]